MDNVQSSSKSLQLHESLPRCLTFHDKISPPGSPKEDLCPFCKGVFDFDKGQNLFLKHLLEQHKLVIGEVKMIADFPRYIYYWRDRLLCSSIDEFCTIINTNTKDTDMAETERYYLLCDALPEDLNLRKKLHKDKLEELLTLQASERNSLHKYLCLFCKHEDTRSEILQHMLTEHTFNIGHPDNLVNTAKLFKLLQSNLDNLKCLYCERTFTSRHVLKEHMRKKKHKRINENNKTYDEFYINNYLEYKKVGNSKENESNSAAENEEIENNWDDWVCTSNSLVHCLFCECKYRSISNVYVHMKREHLFDFKHIKLDLDFYSQIKLVNFIRYKNYNLTCYTCSSRFATTEELNLHYVDNLHSEIDLDAKQWDQPQFYFSTFEDDAFLCSLQDNDDDDDDE